MIKKELLILTREDLTEENKDKYFFNRCPSLSELKIEVLQEIKSAKIVAWTDDGKAYFIKFNL